MSVPTVSWNESTPAGGDSINAGDNRIRELKTQIREVIDVDHDFPSSGSAADVGQHKKVTLQEQADLGTGATGKTYLGGQTVSGKPELVYTDEDDNDVQITSGGYLLGDSLVDGSNDFQSSALKTALIDFLYPVGTIYTEITGTNPGTTFGVGTWTAFGAGRVPVGYNSGDSDFDTAEETGGSKTVDLSHDHTVGAASGGTAKPTDGSGGVLEGTGQHTHTLDSQLSSTQSIVQPYIVVHMWKRTA